MSCTIVTCYYRFPSKHSYEEYDAWMHNFLTHVHSNIVIFCDEDWVEHLAHLRQGFEDKTRIIVYKWNEMRCATKDMLTYWHKDWERDTERAYHNPLLYTLWNEKTEMVRQTIDMNPFKSEFFCWCDIGCFRDSGDMHRYVNGWPSPSFLASACKDKIYLLNIEPFVGDDLQIQSNGLTRTFEGKNRIGGTIFFGHRVAWNTWHTKYYDTLRRYTECDYFAGKDQNIMATMVALYPSLVHLVTPSRRAEDGDPWFYLQRYFLRS